MRQLSVRFPNAASQQIQEAVRSLNRMDYLYMQHMLPLFQQYMPEKAALISNRLQQLGGNLSTQERNQMDSYSSLFKGETTVSDLMSKAEQETNQQQKDLLYSRAAQMAIQAGDFEEAFSIIEKIKNESMKSNLGSSLRIQAVKQALEKGEMGTAYRYAKDVSDLFTRADLFGQIAQRLAAKPDLARANEILSAAEKSLDKADNKSDKALALLALSAAAAKIDPPHGFEVLKTAVDTLNRANYDPPPAAVMSLLRPDSSVYGIELDRSFAPLARADFQRALGLAQSIEKKEMSVLAQLSVCRGVLLKPRQKQTENKDQAKEPTESKK